MNIKWNESMINYLEENINSYNDEDMAKNISIEFDKKITKNAVRKKRQRRGFFKKAHRGYFKIII